MNGPKQIWLVAAREMRERGRARGFRAGLLIMLLVVVAAIVVPGMLETGRVATDVGVTGVIAPALPRALSDQGDTVDVTVRVHRYEDVVTGEAAVHEGDIDVLVVDGRMLEWRGDVDERVRAVVIGAIQSVAVRARAAAAGISPEELEGLVAPVAVENIELGSVAGSSPDNETAAALMSILLLVAIVTYGNLVLTGVVEEKSSRVVEVLLARMPARNLLVGKVTGIGLLGLAQIALTALAAVVATIVVSSVDIPAVSPGVLTWVVVWFLLGNAIYSIAYGALGSLASQVTDASSVAGPVSYALVAAYWVSYISVARDPDGGWAQLVSFFPATAPFAMPGRIALGAIDWWEPVLAVVLTCAAIAGLIVLAGRVYTGAILHTGTRLRLRDAWRRAARTEERQEEMGGGTPATERTTDYVTPGVLVLAIAGGSAVALLADDVVIGVAVAAAAFAIMIRTARAWAGRSDRHPSHP
jgi:ABC-2 type transport system permease protein